MNLLLDTHSFLWFISGSDRLSQAGRSLIEDESNVVYLSTASLWEIAIKTGLGKLTLSEPFATLIPEQLGLNKIELLNISVDHASRVVSLPLHHRDPFDRMLAAQALTEEIPVLSNDQLLDVYGVKRVW